MASRPEVLVLLVALWLGPGVGADEAVGSASSRSSPDLAGKEFAFGRGGDRYIRSQSTWSSPELCLTLKRHYGSAHIVHTTYNLQTSNKRQTTCLM